MLGYFTVGKGRLKVPVSLGSPGEDLFFSAAKPLPLLWKIKPSRRKAGLLTRVVTLLEIFVSRECFWPAVMVKANYALTSKALTVSVLVMASLALRQPPGWRTAQASVF
jgi:hypothetical protein